MQKRNTRKKQQRYRRKRTKERRKKTKKVVQKGGFQINKADQLEFYIYTSTNYTSSSKIFYLCGKYVNK